MQTVPLRLTMEISTIGRPRSVGWLRAAANRPERPAQLPAEREPQSGCPSALLRITKPVGAHLPCWQARGSLLGNPQGFNVNSRGRKPTVGSATMSSALKGPNACPPPSSFDPSRVACSFEPAHRGLHPRLFTFKPSGLAVHWSRNPS